MSDLFEVAQNTAEAGNLPPYTVGELSQALKRTVESAFGLVRVRGEIAQPKLAATGHLYLSLKDADAVLDAVCWRGTVSKLGIRPEHGMDVICTGRMSTYAKSSRYQLVIESMELAGEGALLKMLEDRKRRLAAEGLFDPSRKKALPHIPESIGIVTSPGGAVIHDMLHRLADRFPRHVMLWPVAVQGSGAAEQIAAAIDGFNRLEEAGDVPRPAVLIVARGGGSLEDLMPFNEEIVVRAVAASHIPVISAVGHETDTTLCDFAADLRAPTPTAAAEFAVPVRAELVMRVAEMQRRLEQGVFQIRERQRTSLSTLARGLSDPRRLMEGAAQTLDDRAERLCRGASHFVRSRMLHLARDAALLKHPQAQLAGARHRLELFDEGLRRSARETVTRRRLQLTPLAVRPPADLLKSARQDLVNIAGRGRRARLRLIENTRVRFMQMEERLDPKPLLRLAADWRYTLENRARHLESVSYHRVLERGYAVVRGADGHAVAQAGRLKPGQQVTLEFVDGVRKAGISDT